MRGKGGGGQGGDFDEETVSLAREKFKQWKNAIAEGKDIQEKLIKK